MNLRWGTNIQTIAPQKMTIMSVGGEGHFGIHLDWFSNNSFARYIPFSNCFGMHGFNVISLHFARTS